MEVGVRTIKVLASVDDLKPLVSRSLEDPQSEGEREIAERLQEQITIAERADRGKSGGF